jgi:hypothetical protein
MANAGLVLVTVPELGGTAVAALLVAEELALSPPPPQAANDRQATKTRRGKARIDWSMKVPFQGEAVVCGCFMGNARRAQSVAGSRPNAPVAGRNNHAAMTVFRGCRSI